MTAVKFLKLEDFLDNQRHGIAIHLEPQGILFAEVNHNTHQGISYLSVVGARGLLNFEKKHLDHQNWEIF